MSYYTLEELLPHLVTLSCVSRNSLNAKKSQPLCLNSNRYSLGFRNLTLRVTTDNIGF